MRKHPKVIVIEKTWEEVKQDCRNWAKSIRESFQPDLIVFIAKSGFAFACPMNEVFQCEMVDIKASRPATGTKDFIKPIIECLPKSVVYGIISSPLSYWFHGRRHERSVIETDRLLRECKKEHKKILIVDDSLDTGWTMRAAHDKIATLFPHAEIKVAVYAIIDGHIDDVVADYARNHNMIIVTATSRRSDEYDLFLSKLTEWNEGIDSNE